MGTFLVWKVRHLVVVFKDLDLTFEPGQRVGLVGPSEGGKSSLLALIRRFYDLHGGRITIDGQDGLTGFIVEDEEGAIGADRHRARVRDR